MSKTRGAVVESHVDDENGVKYYAIQGTPDGVMTAAQKLLLRHNLVFTAMRRYRGSWRAWAWHPND